MAENEDKMLFMNEVETAYIHLKGWTFAKFITQWFSRMKTNPETLSDYELSKSLHKFVKEFGKFTLVNSSRRLKLKEETEMDKIKNAERMKDCYEHDFSVQVTPELFKCKRCGGEATMEQKVWYEKGVKDENQRHEWKERKIDEEHKRMRKWYRDNGQDEERRMIKRIARKLSDKQCIEVMCRIGCPHNIGLKDAYYLCSYEPKKCKQFKDCWSKALYSEDVEEKSTKIW